MYSLIHTARFDELNPFVYLDHVFTQAAMVHHDCNWEALLTTNLHTERINVRFPATVL